MINLLFLMPRLILMAVLISVPPTTTVTRLRRGVAVLSAAFVVMVARRRLGIHRFRRRCTLQRLRYALWKKTSFLFFLLATLDDLVEFSPVKPNTSTLRSIVYFNVLTFRHYQQYFFANWAVHGSLLQRMSYIKRSSHFTDAAAASH